MYKRQAVDDVTAEDWGQTTLTKIVVPVAGEGVSGATKEDIPAGYTTCLLYTSTDLEVVYRGGKRYSVKSAMNSLMCLYETYLLDDRI